jgi:predicted nucleic-acid-binding protein
MGSNHESLDTNILLRLLLGDVPAQQAQAIKLLKPENVRFDVSDLAITEMVYVLETTHSAGRTEVVASVSFVLNLQNVNCNRKLFNSVLPAYLSHPKLSFVDCCLAEYARLNQAEPLWTFDKKLAVQSGTAKKP